MKIWRRTVAAIRGLLFRELTIFVLVVLAAIASFRFAGAWISVPNPYYDPAAGRVEDCGSDVDQFGNYAEECWDTNEPEYKDDGRLNVVIVIYFGAILLGPLAYKRIKPTIAFETARRKLRKDFLRGEVGATEMESVVEMHRYFALLEKWVAQKAIDFKHAYAARCEWARNPGGPHVWRYPTSVLRKMYDSGELTLSEFESLNQQNEAWFGLPDHLRQEYREGRISEKEFHERLEKAGYDSGWWNFV